MTPPPPGPPAERVLVSSFDDGAGAGGVWAWDGRRLERLHHHRTMGIALGGPGTFGQLVTGSERSPRVTELVRYDAGGVRRYDRLDAVVHAHDLHHDAARDEWVVVSSGDDRIVWFDAGGEVVRTWEAPDDPPGRHGDAWHVNCLVETEGRLLATAFGAHRDAAARHARVLEPDGFLFDVDTGERVLTGLVSPHHPVRVDGSWVVCSSSVQRIDRYADDGDHLASLTLGGWPRGAVRWGDRLVVGLSTRRGHASGRAYLAIVDLATFREVERVPFPAKQLYDLIVVPEEVVGWVRAGWAFNPGGLRPDVRSAVHGLPGVGPVAAWSRRPGPVRAQARRAGRAALDRAVPLLERRSGIRPPTR